MASEMIERVARILEPQAWAALGTGDTMAYANRRTSSLRKAKKAIEAMREPTPEMTSGEGVQTNCHMCGGHAEGWRLMIDTALAEPLPIHDRLTDDDFGSREVEEK